MSAASTLTTISPTARTTLSMAAYRAVPAEFATIQRRYPAGRRSCVWWYRRSLSRSRSDLLQKGVMPGLGGAILLIFFGYGLYYNWLPVNSYSVWHVAGLKIGGAFITGVGTLVLGVILMEIYRRINPPFFRGETLNADTPILVPELDASELFDVLAHEGIVPPASNDPRPQPPAAAGLSEED